MLPSSLRLPKSAFGKTKTPFRFFSSDYFTLRFRANTLSHLRMSIIVSKKIDKRAVVRNRLKRRVSTALQAQELPMIGKDLLFFLKKGALEATNQQIQEALSLVMKKII